jgi:hypothetical protein
MNSSQRQLSGDRLEGKAQVGSPRAALNSLKEILRAHKNTGKTIS